MGGREDVQEIQVDVGVRVTSVSSYGSFVGTSIERSPPHAVHLAPREANVLPRVKGLLKPGDPRALRSANPMALRDRDLSARLRPLN